ETSNESLFHRYLVSVARLAPKGRRRKAQGVSPGNKCSKNGSPEGAKQSVPILQRSAYDEYLSVVETDLPALPFQCSLQFGTHSPGLAPWAVLLDSGSVVLRQKLGPLGGHKVHKMVKFVFIHGQRREGTTSAVPKSAPAGRKELSRG